MDDQNIWRCHISSIILCINKAQQRNRRKAASTSFSRKATSGSLRTSRLTYNYYIYVFMMPCLSITSDMNLGKNFEKSKWFIEKSIPNSIEGVCAKSFGITLWLVDFSKVFRSINRGKIKQKYIKKRLQP